MKSALSSLQEKRDAFDKMKKNYEDTVAYIEVCGICIYRGHSALSKLFSRRFHFRSKPGSWRDGPGRSSISFTLSSKPRRRPRWQR